MNKIQKIALITAAMIVIASSAFYISYWGTYKIMQAAPQENTKRVNDTVQAVCDYAIQIDEPNAYRICGAAQETSETEYICANDTSTVCWIEDKR